MVQFTQTTLPATPTAYLERPSSYPLDNERTRSYFAVVILFFLLATLAVVGRFWARKLKNIRWKLDDWLALGSLIVFWGHCAIGIWALWGCGLGHHRWAVTHQQAINMYKQLFIIQFPYAVEMTLVRLSICTLFLRIFVPRWFRWCMWFSIALNIAWALFVMISALTICHPISANWNRHIPGSHCASSPLFYVIIAAWAIVLDLIIWICPQAVVWKLQMRMIDKVCVSMIFAIGVLDIVVSGVRIEALLNLHLTGDFTYTDVYAQLWSTIEPAVAIIVACAPMMRVLLEKIMPDHMLRRMTHHTWQRMSTSRRRSQINRDIAKLVPNNRPQSDCVAKRVSSDDLLNAKLQQLHHTDTPASGKSQGGWLSSITTSLVSYSRSRGNQTDGAPSPRRSKLLRWWDSPSEKSQAQVSRDHQRRTSQQIVTIRHDVSVTTETDTSRSPTDLSSLNSNTIPSSAFGSGAGSSTAGESSALSSACRSRPVSGAVLSPIDSLTTPLSAAPYLDHFPNMSQEPIGSDHGSVSVHGFRNSMAGVSTRTISQHSGINNINSARPMVATSFLMSPSNTISPPASHSTTVAAPVNSPVHHQAPTGLHPASSHIDHPPGSVAAAAAAAATMPGNRTSYFGPMVSLPAQPPPTTPLPIPPPASHNVHTTQSTHSNFFSLMPHSAHIPGHAHSSAPHSAFPPAVTTGSQSTHSAEQTDPFSSKHIPRVKRSSGAYLRESP